MRHLRYSRTKILLALAFALTILLPLASPVDAVPEFDRERPTKWAPTSITTVMTNDPQVAEVNYWFKWEGPGSWSSSFWNEDVSVLEFGWKDTGNDGCDRTQAGLGQAGWPNGTDVRVDWTEDLDDAIVWINNVNPLKFEILFEPGNEYAVWWGCIFDNDFISASNPNFQVAQNVCAPLICGPSNTFSSNVMNYVPSEQGWKGLPINGNDLRQIQTNMDAPWLGNGNFETGLLGPWSPYDSSATVFTGSNSPHQGDSFVYVQPTFSGQGNVAHSWIYQSFKVGNSGTRDPQFELGANTGLQYEGVFRCPTWADDWAGQPGQQCRVTVYMKTKAETTWYSKTWLIDPTWTWQFALDANSPSMTSDDDVDIWIDTHGFPLDIDAQWVSSDI